MISPEKLMSSSDMARVGCNGCEGCCECCKNRGSSITLDSWDVSQLKDGLNRGFQELVDNGFIVLEPVNGVILPVLGKKRTADECIFLGEDGRCRIHPFRPGICRMFPLARLYHEDGSFSYFLQEGECERPNGVKIKISKWLEIRNITEYEKAVRSYHDRLVELRNALAESADSETAAKLQKQFLIRNFLYSPL